MNKTITIALLSVIMMCLLAAPAMAADFWESDSDIVAGLGDVGYGSEPTVFNKDGTWYLIAGEDTATHGGFYGFHWTGSAWVSDPAIVSGLGSVGRYANPTVFCIDETWYLISGAGDGAFYGWRWTGSAWVSDPAIVSGLSNIGDTSAPTVFNKDGTWCLIAGENDGVFNGYKWTGSGWQKYAGIVSGLGDVDYLSKPTVFNKDGTWYLIAGGTDRGSGLFYGYIWTGRKWEPDPAVVSGLVYVSSCASPTVFNMDGAWHLISGEVYGRFYGFSHIAASDFMPTAINVPALFVNQPSTAITATIANIGNLDASSFNVSLSAGGSVVDTANVPSLSVGASTNVSFEWTPASAGDIELCVIADSGNAIDELFEDNNKLCTMATVNAPDLTPTAIAAPDPFVNQSSTITATIENIGAVDAASFNVSLSAGGNVVDTANVPSLSAGNSTNVNFEWTSSAPGTYELCVFADADNAIVELDETNNEIRSLVTVSEIPEEIVWYYVATMPWDAERLSDGNTLITEYGGHTVTEVTPAGAIVWQYGTGTQGSGPGELNCPHAVKRLSSGNTLIADYNNHHVIEVNSSGATVWQYGTGTPGSGTNQLNFPTDAERLSGGNTLIADRSNNRVIEVDNDKTIVWEMTGLNHPFDADRLDNGNTLITDYRNHRVIEVDLSGAIVWQYGTGIPDEYGSGVNELYHPIDAERLPNGNTMIADYLNDRVIDVRTSDYDPAKANNGFTVCSILWSYESNHPTDAECISDGNTLICEAGNNRVIEIVTPPEELNPSTTFFISGWVNYDTGDTIDNPLVNITNLDTSEVFTAERNESSNYYQVLTGSCNVNAGNVLRFSARDNGNVKEFDHPVSDTEMNHGGFVWNITIVRPIVPMPDLTVTAIDAYHYSTYASPWFNLSNEVDVTVSNIGSLDAGTFNVSLYANDEFIGKLPVSSMSAGSSETVQFNWIPIGCDCDDGCGPETYTLKVIADCDGNVDELIETNNESTTTEEAFWNGYAADEPLENIASGRLNGGLIYTTGTGAYTGLYTNGASMSAQYDIALPDSAAVELARLNVYYTWVYPKQTRPEMEVSITNQTGTYVLTTDRYYDDRKCWGSWDMYWGNWVYDVTPYIQESGVYSVTVKNVATGSVCPAGPGIVILYRDETKPLIDYWINEGGDVLEAKNGRLRYSEAITNATFDGSIAGVVANATLGLVNPWANSYPDGSEVFFNGISLGQDVYCGGYGHPLYCSKSMSVVDMETNVGDSSAEVAISLLDVKDYLNESDNYAGMGDIKDIGALPANAFLVVEYEGEEMIPAGVTFDKKIDLNSSGVLKAYITLPEGYDVANIDVATIECEGAPVFGDGRVIPGKQALEVKFKISDLVGVPTGDAVLLTVTGELYDGTRFEGSNMLEVV